MITLRALTLGLAACLAVATARAETTIPEERLVQQMYQGDRDQARAGLKALADARLADVSRADGSSSPDALARRATLLSLAVRALEAWEGAEAGLRVQGFATPDSVLHDIVDRVHQVDGLSNEMEAAEARLPSEANAPERRAARASAAPVARLMVKTVALTKGTSLERSRGAMLDSARRLAPVPPTAAQFDAEHSLEETFNLQLTPPPAKRAPTAPGTPAPAVAAPGQAAPAEATPPPDDAAVRALVGTYVGALVRGDLPRCKKLFVRGYWPKRTMRQLARRFAGSELGDLGPLIVQPAGGSELDVTLDEVTLVDAAARDRVTFRLRSHVLLRRVGAGYRIAGIGARKGANR